MGTNELMTFDLNLVLNALEKIHEGTWKAGAIPPLWDGNATRRILEVLRTFAV
jgi:UDP-N-acetylglucosamine 2-epimerase (non-hydrolysing)